MASMPPLPCARCGRSAPAGATLCDRCAAPPARWEVRAGAQRLELDADGLRARVADGSLTGVDMVATPGGFVPLALHPSFRSWFLPGSADAVATVAKAQPVAAPRAGGRSPLAVGLAVVGVVGLLAGAGYAARQLLPGAPAPVASLAPAPKAPAPPTPAEPVAAAVAPAVPAEPVAASQPGDPVAALLARVGTVEEPRAQLVAGAWARRNEGGADALDAGIALAERAVARAPDDPEALGTLADLYAEAGKEPELAAALLTRAKGGKADGPVVARAEAMAALGRDKGDEALRVAEACLAASPGALLCREVALYARESLLSSRAADAENLLYTVDELAKAWPENAELGRRGALLAARAEVPSAEDRLAAAAKKFPKDAKVADARALLLFRDGASKAARKILAGLDAPSDLLRTEAAGDALGRGDPAEALALLGKIATPNRDARLYETQARWLLARAGKGKAEDAVAAGKKLAELDATSPAAAQARAGAALAAGDKAAASNALDRLVAQGTGVDVARTWEMRAALDLAQNHPRDAVISLESAKRAHVAHPEVHLWAAAAEIASQNGPGAVTALREAITAIDGSDSRRRPYGATIPIAPAADAFAGLDALLTEDRADDRAVAKAVIAWLGGDVDAALAAVSPVAEKGTDADALALQARLLQAKGRHADALVAIDGALARSPRTPNWHLLRAEILLSSNRVKDAETALAAARSGKVDAGSLQLLVARVAVAKKDDAAALVARRAAAQADPSDLAARRALRGVTED